MSNSTGFARGAIKGSIFSVFLVAALVSGFFIAALPALAAVTVTPATGGTGISIDKTLAPGGTATWITLAGPVIAESAVGNIAAGVHTLTLPAGWEFNTTQNVTIGIGGSTDLSLGAQVVTPLATTLSFNITNVSSTGVATLTFSDIKVRPTGTVSGTFGNITQTAGSISGVTNSSTSFGALSTVAGTVTKVAFTTQPGATTVYGSNLSTQPVVKTQDQFGNNSVAGLIANKNVTLTLTSGTGSLLGTAMLDIGTSVGNGVVTYSGLQVNAVGIGKQLTAAAPSLTSAISSSFGITQKALTATVTASNKTYDGSTSAIITGRTLVGVVAGDTVNVSGGTATFADAGVGTAKVVTASGMSIAGADAAKYTFGGTGTGTANITKLEVVVTAEAKTKVYGNADPVLTYTLSAPLIAGNFFTGTLSRATGQSVGTYAINQGGLLADPNYLITFVSANLSVTARPITVTASNNSKVYDGNTNAVAIPVVTGSLAFSDTPNFTESYNTPAVGTGKTLTPAGSVTSVNSGTNYAITFVTNITGAITAKGLTVSGLLLASKVYDGNTTAVISGTPSLVGVVGSDVVSVTGTAVGTFNTAIVGSNTVAVSGLSLAGAQAGNYTLTQPTLTANITAKPITVTATAGQTKVYGASDPVFFTYTNPTLITGNSFTGALSRATGQSVGTYPIIQGNLSAGSNYSITFVPANFSITQAPLIITAVGKTKVYGATNPTLTVSYTGLKNGDLATATLPNISRASGENVASYVITPSGAVDANYSISYVTGTFTITKAPLTITAGNKSKEFGASDPALTYVTSTLTNGDGPSVLSGSLIRASGESVNTYAINQGTVSAGGNYNVTYVAGTFSIVDTTPPVIAAHADVNTVANQLGGAVVTYTSPNAVDAVDGTLPAICLPVSGSVFLIGTTIVTCNKTDAHGNVATPTTFNVIVTPATIFQLAISANPTNLDISLPSTITVTGKDQYGNVVTNNSSTIVVLSADNGGSLNTALLTLASGVKTTTLTKSSAGLVHVIVSSGLLSPAQAVVTFTATPVTPTVTLHLGDTAIVSAYSVTDANTRFAAGVRFDVTNAASVTVNGSTVVPVSGVVTAASNVVATTLGAHTYNVIVTSSTGHTANMTISYQVVANTVTPVTPTVSLNGVAIVSAYSATAAATRFASGLQFTTTNAASITVNGTSITPATTITAATLSAATTLGTHTYNVVVTSATGHVANATVSYQVNADPVVQGNGTLAVTGINTVKSTMTADASYANGGSWTFLITVPTSETSLSLKFGDWVSGLNSIATANNMRVYSAQSSNAATVLSAITLTAANTYSTVLTLTGDLDPNTAGRQVQVTVDLKVPTGTAGGAYSTNYAVQSN